MPGAIFILFLLTLFINPLIKLIYPSASLGRRELLLVYIMMVMASPIPHLFIWRLLCSLTYPFYYATPENEWRELILPHLPNWMMPHSPQTARLFYEGAGGGQPIPWAAWEPIFLAWLPFIWALFLVMIAAMVILRRQWIVNERLIFPLMQVPLAMVEEAKPGDRVSGFFKNPVMWVGFSLPALWGTLHGLYNYFPDIVPVATYIDPVRMDIELFHNIQPLFVALRFNIIGFFYFLKTEIAFSLWFFNLLSYVARGVFGLLGIVSTETSGAGHPVPNLILAYQAMGAMLALFFGGLWTARLHLQAVFRKAFRGDMTVDDSDEILSYRAAVLVLLVGSLVLVTWLWLAGMPIWVALGLLFLGSVIIFGYTRVVSEGGLSDGSPPVVPAGILVSAVGTSAIGPSGLAILGVTMWWTIGRNFVMTACAQSLRMGEDLGGNKRPLFWVIIAALAIALCASVWTIMYLSHAFGAINLSWIYGGGFSYVEKLMRTTPDPNLWTWINMAIGTSIMGGLMVARRVYLWWPFHPLGYAIGPVWIMDHLWFNMFLAWLIKVLVLKYGGARLYIKTRPFFIGMILGYFTPGGFYMIIDHFNDMNGNIIFWG